MPNIWPRSTKNPCSGTGPTLWAAWAAQHCRRCGPMWMRRGQKSAREKPKPGQKPTTSARPPLSIRRCLNAALRPPRLAVGMRGFGVHAQKQRRSHRWRNYHSFFLCRHDSLPSLGSETVREVHRLSRQPLVVVSHFCVVRMVSTILDTTPCTPLRPHLTVPKKVFP